MSISKWIKRCQDCIFTVSLVMRCYWKVKLICTQAILLKLQTLCNWFCLFCEDHLSWFHHKWELLVLIQTRGGWFVLEMWGILGGSPPLPPPPTDKCQVTLSFRIGFSREQLEVVLESFLPIIWKLNLLFQASKIQHTMYKCLLRLSDSQTFGHWGNNLAYYW